MRGAVGAGDGDKGPGTRRPTLLPPSLPRASVHTAPPSCTPLPPIVLSQPEALPLPPKPPHPQNGYIKSRWIGCNKCKPANTTTNPTTGPYNPTRRS
jgi:hypothetical protein